MIPNYYQIHGDGIMPIKPLNSCPRCGKTYKHDRNLYRHMKVECGQQPRYYCRYCPYRSKHKSDTYKHVVRIHDGGTDAVLFDNSF